MKAMLARGAFLEREAVRHWMADPWRVGGGYELEAGMKLAQRN
jgi:hypothetical protein